MKMKSVVFGLLLAAVSLYTPAYADAVITVQLVNHGVCTLVQSRLGIRVQAMRHGPQACLLLVEAHESVSH